MFQKKARGQFAGRMSARDLFDHSNLSERTLVVPLADSTATANWKLAGLPVRISSLNLRLAIRSTDSLKTLGQQSGKESPTGYPIQGIQAVVLPREF